MGRTTALRRALAGACMLIGLLALPGTALAAECTSTWTGAASGEWQVAGNWSPEGVPTSTDVACIPNGKVAELTSGAHQVAILQGEGELDITAGSLALLGAEASNIGILHMPGGALRGSAQLFVTASLVASGGSMEAAGETVVGTGALARVEPSGEPEGPGLRVTEKRVLTVKGELVVAGAVGRMNLLEGASVIVASGGALTVGGPDGRITAKESSSLTNSGTMTTNGPGGQTNLIDNADFLNTGSFALKASEGGFVALGNASVENMGSFRMEAAAGEIRLEETTFRNKSGLRIEAPEGRLRGSQEARVENMGTLAINGEGEGNGLVAGPGGTPRLINDGTVRKDEGGGMAVIEFKIANEDLVKAESGSLAFTAGGNSGQEHKDKWVVDEAGEEIAFGGALFTLGELAEIRGQILLWNSATVKGHRILGSEAEVLVAGSSDLDITGANEKSKFEALLMSSGEISLIKNGLLDAEAVFVENGVLDFAASTEVSVESLFQEDGKTSLGNAGSLSSEGVYLEGGRFALDTNTDFQVVDYFQEGNTEASLEPGSQMSSNDIFVSGGSLELRANTMADIGQVFLMGGSFDLRKEAALSGNEAYLDGGSLSLGTSSAYLVSELFEGGTTTTVGGDASLVSEDAFLSNGLLTGDGNFLTDNLSWENARMAGSGTTIVSKVGLIANEASASLDQRRLFMHGFFSLGESTLVMGDGARLVNDAVFDASSELEGPASQIRVSGSSSSNPRIVNKRQFKKESGGGTTKVSVPFENDGAIRELSGTLRILNRLGVSASERFGFRCHCGDPVETSSGDLTETQADIAVGGRGLGLELVRSYSAQAAAAVSAPGIFGYGWVGSFSDRLRFEEEGEVITVERGDGSTVPFVRDEKGAYQPPVWSQDSLSGNSETGFTYRGTDQIQRHFAPSGALQNVVDRNGNETTLTYDEAGRLKAIKDPVGRSITLAYNEEGLVESAEDPMGHLVQYSYEGKELTSVTMPGGEGLRWQFDYDGSHRMTTLINGRGGETINEFDGASRVLTQTDPAGRTLSFFYDGFHTRFTNEDTGAVTDMWFNSNNQPTSITRGYGTEEVTTETFAYDESGRQVSRTDGNGHTTAYTYNAAGDRTSVTDPEEGKWEWAYDATHDVISETTPRGLTTTIVRDAAGNPEAVSRPAPGEATQTTTYDYDSLGQLKSMTDPLERTWTYEYDAKGNLETETDPEGNTGSWGYDENSRVTSAVSPRGNEEGSEPSEFTTTIQRDPQGRPEKVVDPLGHDTEFAYDGNGNLQSETNAKGKTTEFVYNGADELVETKKPSGAVLKTEYDGSGEIVAKIDGNEEKTTYVRNVLGQPVEIIDPLSRKVTQEFDAAGNLESILDPMERVTSYVYDSADRLVEIAYSEEATPDIGFAYDAEGNMTGMVDGSGESTYVYDQLGRLEEVTNGHGDAVSYGYDLAGQQKKVVYPNGKDIDKVFDDAGRLESLTDWLGKTTNFVYDADSNLKEIQFPTTTGNVDEFTYDRAGRMTAASFEKGAEPLASIAYERDPLGQVEAMVSAGLPGPEEVTYEYDANNRLLEAGAETFGYDNADNPIATPGSTNAFDDASQLEAGTNVTYGYSPMGERTKSTPSSGPATNYGYDQDGKLTSVERAAEGEAPAIDEAFAFDGVGLLTSQTSDLVTRYMTWDVSASLPLLLDDGVNSYVYGPGGLPITQISAEGEPTYLHHDQLGSTRLLTDATGKVAAGFSYTAYGDLAGKTGSATTPLGYAGQYTDAETGLQYLRARFYDPGTAQFLTRDPIELLTGQPYVYAFNNPLQFGDPTGLFAIALPLACATPLTAAICAGAASGTACAASGACRDAVGDEAAGVINSITGDSDDEAEGEGSAPYDPSEAEVECPSGEFWDDYNKEIGDARESLDDAMRFKAKLDHVSGGPDQPTGGNRAVRALALLARLLDQLR